MIDRSQIGWPVEPDLSPFDGLRPHVEGAALELGYDYTRGWQAIYQGAARFVVELELGSGPPPTVVDGEVVSVAHTAAGSQSDIHFGLRL